MKIPYLSLLHSDPIFVPMVGSIRIPTVNDVRKLGGLYAAYMEVLCLDDKELAEHLNIPLSGCSRYEFVITNQKLKDFYTQIFDFFFIQSVVFQEFSNFWILTDDNKRCTGTINEENFHDVCNCILICNHLEAKKSTELKFYNEKARLIYEKMKKNPFKKTNAGIRASIGDVVSAVASNSSVYSLFNIWDLTVYQLYDQFAKLNQRVHFDVASRQWAAYPSEKFDLSQWYTAPQQNKEE